MAGSNGSSPLLLKILILVRHLLDSLFLSIYYTIHLLLMFLLHLHLQLLLLVLNFEGSKNDLDFYYAIAKATDRLPPAVWSRISNNTTRDPCPKVIQIRIDQQATDSIRDFSNVDIGNYLTIYLIYLSI
jgi:hypothetical protein